MMLSNIIDVTIVEDTPFKKNIETKVIGRADFSKLLYKIKEEMCKKHLDIIVYPFR